MDYKRQIAILHIAFSQLWISYEATIKAWEEAKKEYSKEELKELEEDINKLKFLVSEMRIKLSLYDYLAKSSQAVMLKILKGLNAEKTVSNIEVFASLMVMYFEEVQNKRVLFSKRFKEIVYEIDLIAFDDVGTESIKKAAKISEQIFKRVAKGDYLEFKAVA